MYTSSLRIGGDQGSSSDKRAQNGRLRGVATYVVAAVYDRRILDWATERVLTVIDSATVIDRRYNASWFRDSLRSVARIGLRPSAPRLQSKVGDDGASPSTRFGGRDKP